MTSKNGSLAEFRNKIDGTPLYRELRAERPVYFDPDWQMWIVSRYDDIATVFKQPNLFSNALALFHSYRFEDVVNDILVREGHGPFTQVLPMTDPPTHTRVRAIVNTVFSPRRVAKIQNYIDQLTQELIDGFIDDGKAELVSQFAVPLPVTVISDLLSLPRERWADIKRWTFSYSACAGNRLTTKEEAEAVGRDLADMQNYIVGHLKDRRVNPGDDLLTDLVNARFQDFTPLDDMENLAVAVAFVGAGHESTTVAITQLVRILAERPDLIREIRQASDQDTAIRLLVEESLRYEPPLNALPRVTTADTEVGGVKIPAFSPVMVIMASANRDESQFGADAELFAAARQNANRHMAFGGGVHACLGNMLARGELRSVARAFINRFDNLRLAKPVPEVPEEDYSQAIMPWNLRLHKLDILFDKRA